MAFRRVAEPLSPHFRLIMPDLPAHGRDESYQLSAVRPAIGSLVDWLEGFHDEVLGAEPAHWVGHSLGASLAYHLAHRYPSRFRSMTMVSPGLRIPGSPLTSYALDRLPASVATLGANRLGLSLYQPLNWRGEAMTRAEAAEYLRPMRSRSRMKFILRLGARLVDGEHPELNPIDAPTLVLWGKHDHILPLEDAYLVEERLEARLHIVEESGHSPMEDTPAEFTRHLLDFLL
jgi:pimeloyl-ACP methyl ester carboxylesterase